MMAARKNKTSLHVVDEQTAPERKGLPRVRVYFPNAARLKECRDTVQAEYEAGRLQSPSVSAFFYSLYCRYLREQANQEQERLERLDRAASKKG